MIRPLPFRRRSIRPNTWSKSVSLPLLTSVLACVALCFSPRPACGTVAEVLDHPLYEAWRQSLLERDQAARASSRPGLVKPADEENLFAEAYTELQCGAYDGIEAKLWSAHRKRMDLIQALTTSGLRPAPAPAGVAPWPWGPGAGKSERSNFDEGNTAVLFTDGIIDFVGTCGIEIDPFLASKVFYATHGDDYDFLLLATNFPSSLSCSFIAYHLAVANKVDGLGHRFTSRGADFFDDRDQFIDGDLQPLSHHRLQSFLHLNNINGYPDDPNAPYWRTYSGIGLMAHELGHRWSARLGLWSPLVGPQGWLLGRAGSHWSFFFNNGGSVVEGNEWMWNGSEWQTVSATQTYGPMDLYLMGMMHPDEIPTDQLWYLREAQNFDPPVDIRSSVFNPGSPPQAGVVCEAEQVPFSMDQVYLANSLRRPLYPGAQRAFRAATILVGQHHRDVTAAEFDMMETYRNALASFFHEHTLQRGSVTFELHSLAALVEFLHVRQGNVDDPTADIEIRTGLELTQRSLLTTLDDVSLALHYALEGEPGFTRVEMTRDVDDSFFATIPAQAMGTRVRYYLEAVSGPGATFFEPKAAGSDPHVFEVTPDITAPSIQHARIRHHSSAAQVAIFRALIQDAHGIDGAQLEYRLQGEASRFAELERQRSSDLFEARVDLPGEAGEQVEYRILATDTAVNPHRTTSPATDYHIVNITQAQTTDVEVEDALWTHRSLGFNGFDQWHREPFNHTEPSGFWSWKAGPNNVSTNPRRGEIQLEQNAVLESPVLRMGRDWQFSFWHRFYFRLTPIETDYLALDGGFLEWQDVDVQADVENDKWWLVSAPSYNNYFSPFAFWPHTAFSERYGNRPCYGGWQDFWALETINASHVAQDLSDRNIRFRFHLAASSAVTRTTPQAGWYIDDITFDPGDPIVPTLLQDFLADRQDNIVRIVWRLSDVEAGTNFHIYRASGAGTELDFARLETIAADDGQLEYTFLDTHADRYETYTYRLGIVAAGLETSGPIVQVQGLIPKFALQGNYPNPFNPSTTIRFEIGQRGPTQLQVYDVKGRRVRSLLSEELERGVHEVNWDGRDAEHRRVASGIYWALLRSSGRTFTRAMVLVQ